MSVLLAAFGENAIAIRSKVNNRTEAISVAGELLVQSGRVGKPYVSSMVEAVETHGPYICIAPGIALAHGKPSDHVFETGLSLLVLEQSVRFQHEHNDPIRLVFGLAAKDHISHIDLMAELSEKLSETEVVNSLLTSGDIESIRRLLG
jgi:ascorbate PTS system EIIA or EIIAB component